MTLKYSKKVLGPSLPIIRTSMEPSKVAPGTGGELEAVRRSGDQRLRDARGKLVKGQDFVKRGVLHNARHQGGVHGVAGAFGDDVAEQRATQQGQIANEVEGLVTATLVGRAETAGVEDAGR